MRRTPLTRKKNIKRTPQSEQAKLKADLWKLCKEITRKVHGNTCYSCGRMNLEGANWHTGHFIQSSRCSTELRYDLANLRPQCYHCNINLCGNTYDFGEHLITDHGVEYVQELKQRNEQTKGRRVYGKEWFLSKIDEYKNILETL